MNTQSQNQAPINARIEVLVASDSINMQAAQEYFLQNGQAAPYRDALKIDLQDGEVWLFEYGVLILWGISENDKQRLLNSLKDYWVEPYDRPGVEVYSFESIDGPLRIQM